VARARRRTATQMTREVAEMRFKSKQGKPEPMGKGKGEMKPGKGGKFKPGKKSKKGEY
jgi:hypothetical protein